MAKHSEDYYIGHLFRFAKGTKDVRGTVLFVYRDGSTIKNIIILDEGHSLHKAGGLTNEVLFDLLDSLYTRLSKVTIGTSIKTLIDRRDADEKIYRGTVTGRIKSKSTTRTPKRKARKPKASLGDAKSKQEEETYQVVHDSVIIK